MMWGLLDQRKEYVRLVLALTLLGRISFSASFQRTGTVVNSRLSAKEMWNQRVSVLELPDEVFVAQNHHSGSHSITDHATTRGA
eukprot:6405087-Amphidinium_carterae.1